VKKRRRERMKTGTEKKSNREGVNRKNKRQRGFKNPKYLFISSVVVLNDNSGLCFSILLIVGLFPAFVGPVGLLDDLSGLVQLPLFLIGQGQSAQGLFAFHGSLNKKNIGLVVHSKLSLNVLTCKSENVSTCKNS
jgi:hypothetical protein